MPRLRCGPPSGVSVTRTKVAREPRRDVAGAKTVTRSNTVSKLKPKEQFVAPERGPMLSPRFVVAIVLMLAGIAWIAYYYIGVRAPDGFDKETLQPHEATGPQF